MDVLRTPDERFADLADWEFRPRFQEVTAKDGTRLCFHFVDEGPRAAAPVLLLPGNSPTFSSPKPITSSRRTFPANWWR